MKKILALVIMVFFSCGCIPLLIGTGAVAGYALSNDAAVGHVETEYRILWDLCLDRLEDMDAKILGANESKGLIKTKITNTNVNLYINALDANNQQLKIAARKYFIPKPSIAQHIYYKITKDLE